MPRTGAVGLDVYVTTPGAPLANMSPNFSNLAYGRHHAFTTIATGSYQVRFTLPNSKQVIYDAGTLDFAEQASYQLVAYTKGSGTLVNAALLNLDTVGAGSAIWAPSCSESRPCGRSPRAPRSRVAVWERAGCSRPSRRPRCPRP